MSFLSRFLLYALFTLVAQAQLDVVHWLPPLVTDANGASASNLGDQRLIITTPSTNAINYSVVDGAGVTVSSGTVSNSAPVDILLGDIVGGDYTSQTPGAGNIIDHSQFNTISTEGLKVVADEPIFVNLRQRSNSQGASLTAKGCSAMGTEFRVGLMREREVFGTQDYRNHFISVMATENDTVITFDEFKPGVVVSGGTSTTEPPASGTPLTTDPITVTLQAGESYAIGIHMGFYRGDGATASINDLNGARVSSTRPVVVNSGTFLGSPTSTGARDAGFDQTASIARAGTEYIVIKGGASSSSVLESPMVVAVEDNTDIFINGSLTPINTTPLSAGDYFYLDNNWNADGILYVETSERAMMYATTAGTDSAATSGFSFLPPLDDTISNTVDNIYNINQIGPAILRAVTTAGSTVTFNGSPPANGPLSVTGNSDWVVYTQENVTGNVSVESTGPVAVSVMNFQNPVGAQGYFSGFPELRPTIEATGVGCFPGTVLTAIDPSDGLFQLIEWFYEDGTPTGVTGNIFTPTELGRYFVRGSISATAPCPTADSNIIEVFPCPSADIALEKTVSPAVAAIGDTVTFSITVTNNGPDEALAVAITDIVPSGYSYVTGSITGGTNNDEIDPSGTGLKWEIDSIPATAGSNTATISFDAIVGTGDYINTASATTEALNDDPTDNSDTAEIEIATPGAEVTKALTGLVPNGSGNFTATYLISVENTGNEPLGSIQITDGINQSPNTFPTGSTASIVSTTNLTQNASYDGIGDPRLLAGGDTLAVGATGNVEVEVQFAIDGSQPYQNQAVLNTLATISNTVVNEPSDNPDTAIDDDPTPVNPAANAEIDVAKTLQSITDNGDGSFTAIFLIEAKNTGDEPLINIALNDSISSSFPAGAIATATASSNLTLNTAYDGASQPNLLDGSDRLAPGQSGSVTMEVTFTPTTAGPFENSVNVKSSGEFSGNTAGADDSAEVTPPFNPEMEIEKRLDSLILDGNTSLFTATFTATVTNTGNEAITSLVLQDDLDSSPNNFPAGSIGAIISTSGGFNGNSGFNGNGDVNLLAGTNTLAIGASGSITYTVTFTKDANSPYFNQIQSKAEGQLSGTGESEPSDDPDTVADDDPTLVDPNFDPQIALAKAVDSVVDNGDGTFTANYTLTISSEGNEPINDLSLIDAITTGNSTFPVGASTATITGSTNLTTNSGYNGVADTELLATGNRLAAGTSGTASIAVTFTPDGVGPFGNTANVTGAGEFSDIDVDDAVDSPVNITPPLDPEIGLTKAVDQVSDNGDGTFTADFTLTVTNTGNEPLQNVQIVDDFFLAPSSFPSGSIITVGATSGGLTTNTAYDGSNTTSLLTGNDTLAVGNSGSVVVSITFTPDGNQPYQNQATSTALGQFSNSPDNAISDNPATGAANDATEVNPSLTPAITLLKVLDDTIDNGDGSFTGNFTITVENTMEFQMPHFSWASILWQSVRSKQCKSLLPLLLMVMNLT